MQKFLDGKKTYIGLIVILITLLAESKIPEEQAEQFGTAIFQLIGIAYAMYGNYKAHKKIKENV